MPETKKPAAAPDTRPWHSSTDILDAIHDARTRLVSGETDVAAAHAEARLLSTAAKILMVQLEHAKTTRRLREGSNLLPTFTFDVKPR